VTRASRRTSQEDLASGHLRSTTRRGRQDPRFADEEAWPSSMTNSAPGSSVFAGLDSAMHLEGASGSAKEGRAPARRKGRNAKSPPMFRTFKDDARVPQTDGHASALVCGPLEVPALSGSATRKNVEAFETQGPAGPIPHKRWHLPRHRYRTCFGPAAIFIYGRLIRSRDSRGTATLALRPSAEPRSARNAKLAPSTRSSPAPGGNGPCVSSLSACQGGETDSWARIPESSATRNSAPEAKSGRPPGCAMWSTTAGSIRLHA